MSIDQIVPEALKLAPRDRARLAEALWESLEDPFFLGSEQADDAARALAIQRNEELSSGAVAPISHEQLMKRLRE